MTNQKVTIFAKIVAKKDKVDFVKNELLKLIDTTRAEEGCINYDLHQDNENENVFLFHENWANNEVFQKHIKSAHLTDYLKATKDAVDEFIVNEMTHLA